jgi:hypothetical protein
MLQWTCRLRNVLERRGSLVEITSRRMPEMKEAEFVSSKSGAFPNEFRWDMFRASYDSGSRCAIILDVDRAVPAVNTTTTDDRTFCSLSWQPLLDFSETGINILWLSSTIFISPILFLPDNDVALHEYSISFQDRTDDSLTKCFVYSLSSFHGGTVRAPSLLPLLFLTHLTATLPVDYFFRLFLQRVKSNLQLCPIDHVIPFLSIMSSSDFLQVTPEEKVTAFFLLGDMNADELRVLLSHRFRPTVKLDISSADLDATVSLDIMVDCLKNVPHLRAIELPQRLLFTGTAEDSCRMFEITVNFPRLSVRVGYGDVSPQALHKIARIHPSNEIIASFCWSFLTEYRQHPAKVVGSLLRPFLDGQFTSKSLRVTFLRERGKDDSKRVADLVAFEMTSCKSKSLCFVNCTERICNKSHNQSWNFDRIIRRGIFPSVVLNYFRKRVAHSLNFRVLPMASGAVNPGNV